MKNFKKTIPVQAKASIAFVLASLFSQGMAFITMPIFTRLLTTSEMGYVTTYNAWQVMLGAIVGLSLSSGSFNIAMMKFANKRDQYESSILTLSFIPSILFLLLAIVFREPLANIMGLPECLLILMAVVFIFSPAFNFWLLRQRYEYKYRSVVIVTICNSLIGTLLSIAFVIISADTGLGSLPFARLLPIGATMVLFGLFFSFYILNRGRTGYNKAFWRFALVTSLPMIVQALSKHILDVSDRIMIGAIVGESYVGIYGVLYSISSISLIVWSAINASMVPYIFEKLKSNDYAPVRNISSNIVLIYAGACLVLTILSPEIVSILATSEYESAIYLMPPIAAGIYFTCLHNLYSNLILYKEKTTPIMIATIAAAIVNVFLNLVFIPIFGFISAAYATLISFIVLALLQYYFARKVGQHGIMDDKKNFLISTLFVIACLSINLIYPYRLVRVTILVAILLACLILRKKIAMLFRIRK